MNRVVKFEQMTGARNVRKSFAPRANAIPLRKALPFVVKAHKVRQNAALSKASCSLNEAIATTAQIALHDRCP
jgi:hypothetical protein